MKRNRGRDLWKWVFGIIAIYSIWSNHKTKIWNGFGLEATYQSASNGWGWSDPGSYLKTGASMLANGGLISDFQWVGNLWTLAMPATYAGSLFLVGQDGQFLVPIVAFAVLAWYFCLAMLARVMRHLGCNDSVLNLSLTLFLVSPMFRRYLIGKSLIYSDGWAILAIFTLIIGSIFVVTDRIDVSKRTLRDTFLRTISLLTLGIILGVLILFRNQYVLTLQLILMVFVLTTIRVAYLQIKRSLKTPAQRRIFKPNVSPSLQLLVFTATLLFGALSVVTPYAIWKANRFGDISWDTGGKYALTSSDSFAYAANWQNREEFPNFIQDGGAGTACIIDRYRCAEVQAIEASNDAPFNIYDDEPYTAKQFREMTIETFVSHPLSWSQDRIPYIFRFLGNDPVTDSKATGFGVFYVPWLLISGVSGLILLLRRIAKRADSPKFALLSVGTLFLAVVVGTLGPPFFAHFETRYLIPIRAFLLLTGFIVLSEFFEWLFLKRIAVWSRATIHRCNRNSLQKETHSDVRFVCCSKLAIGSSVKPQ